jgi:hypothetical protein
MDFILKMSKKKPIKIKVEVEFMPFPSKEARHEVGNENKKVSW